MELCLVNWVEWERLLRRFERLGLGWELLMSLMNQLLAIARRIPYHLEHWLHLAEASLLLKRLEHCEQKMVHLKLVG